MAERRSSTQAMETILDRFGLAFDVSIVGMSIVSPEGRLARVNQALCDMLGHSESELLAATWQSLSHPDDPGVELGRGTGPPGLDAIPTPTEKCFVHADGHSVWVLLGVSPLSSDSGSTPLAFFCQMFDITQSKIREEAADQFFDRSREMMCVAGFDGYFKRINSSWERTLGYSVDELLAMPIIDLVHPEDRDRTVTEAGRVAEGFDTISFENRYRNKDGSYRWLQWTATPDFDRNLVFAIARDITEEKLADEEREALERRLQYAQKMEAVGVLAGGAAHNFNNLLAVIQNYATFVIEELGEDDPKRADMAEIVEASRRASKIVKELLAFSRSEGTDPNPLNLNDLVSEAEGLMRGAIGSTIRLQVHKTSGLRTCYINPGQMDQIILNLVLNARQAMPKGGDLTIETANKTVVQSDAKSNPGLAPGEYVCLTVSDSGIGMSEEVKSRIFEPFFTTKGRAVASGLGLASVYGIVKQWGGYIGVRSEPDLGTSMTIYLPAVSKDVSEPIAMKQA